MEIHNPQSGSRERRSFDRKLVVAALVFFFGFPLFLVIFFWASSVHDNYVFNHLSPAQHKQRALAACAGICVKCVLCDNPTEALRHLYKIPVSAPEYLETAKLRGDLENQQRVAKATFAAEIAKSERLSHQSLEESRAQLGRNLPGTDHDPFKCDESTDKTSIMSFDNGNHWWLDDGRCQDQFDKRLRGQQEQHERAQRMRDSDAEIYSFWSTTVRVNTDMNSFWLANEERTCQTLPDDKGRVSVVACNSDSTHNEHNIPVKFWGGIDRNTISNWRCRRENDEFVCRALD